MTTPKRGADGRFLGGGGAKSRPPANVSSAATATRTAARPRAAGSAHSVVPSFNIKKVGDWEKARSLVGPRSSARVKLAERRAVLKEAQFARSKIVEGFRTQAPAGAAWRPLSPTTTAIRRFRGFNGTKALVVRGDLRNSISVRPTPEGAFVGVLRTKTTADGKNLANIAEINENGRTIVMRATPKIVKLLAMAFRKGGLGSAGARSSAGVPGMLIIKIPARPMFRPVWEKWFSDPKRVKFRMLMHVARELRGQYGYPGGSK